MCEFELIEELEYYLQKSIFERHLLLSSVTRYPGLHSSQESSLGLRVLQFLIDFDLYLQRF